MTLASFCYLVANPTIADRQFPLLPILFSLCIAGNWLCNLASNLLFKIFYIQSKTAVLLSCGLKVNFPGYSTNCFIDFSNVAGSSRIESNLWVSANIRAVLNLLFKG